MSKVYKRNICSWFKLKKKVQGSKLAKEIKCLDLDMGYDIKYIVIDTCFKIKIQMYL